MSTYDCLRAVRLIDPPGPTSARRTTAFVFRIVRDQPPQVPDRYLMGQRRFTLAGFTLGRSSRSHHGVVVGVRHGVKDRLQELADHLGSSCLLRLTGRGQRPVQLYGSTAEVSSVQIRRSTDVAQVNRRLRVAAWPDASCQRPASDSRSESSRVSSDGSLAVK